MTDGPTESEYLSAKRTLDDRALNRRVLDTAMEQLPEDEPARIVEVGAGTGTMVERLLEWDVLPDAVSYRAIEREAARAETARDRLPGALSALGFAVEADNAGSITASRDEQRLELTIEAGDALNCTDNADLLVGCAFFDLVALPDALSSLQSALTSSGVVYAPLIYDGLTGFVPEHPQDEAVLSAYHRHMTERSTPGAPHSGRRFLEAVREFDGEVLATGGSDWVLRPTADGYRGDEEQVLSFLLQTIQSSVAELDPAAVDPEVLDEWAAGRRRQLADNALTLVAHNLDVCCRF